MTGDVPDRETARAAIALASRAPSVHNSQPWSWWIGDGVVELRADLGRWLPVADADGIDLLLSCGAVLHHLRVALAAVGVDHDVRRMPDRERPELLARVRLRGGGTRHHTGVDPAHAGAVTRRRTDRRRFLDWPLTPAHLTRLNAAAAGNGALLRAVTDAAGQDALRDAVRAAAAVHGRTTGYDTELSVWTGRGAGTDGIPAAGVRRSVATGSEFERRFAHTRPETGDRAADTTPDGATLLVLGASSDDELSRLRAGEALSAVLLEATTLGLATCPLSEPLEVPGTRALIRDRVVDSSLSPQIVLRVGWPAVPGPPCATPRRPLDQQILAEPPRW